MALDKGKPASPMMKNAATAPTIYFDMAPAFGHLNGVLVVEIAAQMLVPRSDDTLVAELACVAHLRCSLPGAMSLRDALDKAIELAGRPPARLAS